MKQIVPEGLGVKLQSRRLPSFRLSPIAAFITGMAVFTAIPGFAADDATDVAKLQAEIARLKLALEKSQQEIEKQKAAIAAAQASGVPAAVASSPAGSPYATGPAAGNTLETVVITSQAFRNPLVELKDVPRSVSIVSGEELEKLDAHSIDDILKRIGNVQWNYGNPKTGSISIRGISTGGSESSDPSLGVTFDNVPLPYSPLATGLDYTDLESVDVARGPQGFDGGRNTTVGSINVKTRRPTFTPEANATFLIGQNNALNTAGAMSGPVVDGVLAYRVSFLRDQREGEFKNAYRPLENRYTYGNLDRTYGRVQFLLTPSPDFEALFLLDYKPKGIEFVNGTTVRTTTPDPYYSDGTSYNDWTKNSVRAKLNRPYFTAMGITYQNYLDAPINSDNNQGILNGTKGTSLNLTWKLENHTLTSTTAYRNNFFQAANDDGLTADITKDGGLFVHYDFVSQEFKLASNPGNELDYVFGLYANHSQSDAASRTHYGSDAGAYNASQAQYYDVAGAPAIPNYAAVPFGASALGRDAAGILLMQNAGKNLWKETDTYTSNNTLAVYGKTDWHLDKYLDLPLTLATGIRFSAENRRTNTATVVNDEGVGAALNPGTAGGFNSNATTGVLGANTAAQVALANSVAQQYFGVATYAGLSAAQMKQVAYAKSLRSTLRGNTASLRAQTPYKNVLPTGMLSLTYKADEDLSYYAAYQHGAKAGYATAINGTTLTSPVKAETTNNYELGFRLAALEKTLVVNASIFRQFLNNYQTSLYYNDTSGALCNGTTPCYISYSGNVPQVRIKGVELDASYSGIEHFNFRFSGAFNDARYTKDTYLAGNEENGGNVFNAKGYRLAGSPRFSYNLSGEYRVPAFDAQEAHANFNYHWTGAYNEAVQPSIYGVDHAVGILDLGVGLGRRDKTYDLTFLIKNALDTHYKITPTVSSYVPSVSRWFGLQLTGKL